MSPSVISLIGILLGMVILVFLAFKGYNVIIVSVIAALVVAVFAGHRHSAADYRLLYDQVR